MEERAERARWLKSDPDPDLEIPMVIDYINSPPRRDNEIREAYKGRGFYSGYVIDCDRTVLQRKPWAWYGEGGEWWGLPLAPVEELHAFLDRYLANPPSCYGGSAEGAARSVSPGSR